MIHRIFFDIGHEDFDTSTELFLKYPKAKKTPLVEEDEDTPLELENGRFLFKYM